MIKQAFSDTYHSGYEEKKSVINIFAKNYIWLYKHGTIIQEQLLIHVPSENKTGDKDSLSLAKISTGSSAFPYVSSAKSEYRFCQYKSCLLNWSRHDL